MYYYFYYFFYFLLLFLCFAKFGQSQLRSNSAQIPLAGILNDVADDIVRNEKYSRDLFDQPADLSNRELQARMERAVDVAVDRRLTAGRDDFSRLNSRIFDQYIAGDRWPCTFLFVVGVDMCF